MANLTYPGGLPVINIDSSADAASKIVTCFNSIATHLNAANIGSSQLDNTALNAAVPVGTIVQFAGTTAPALWKFCDGSAISRVTYATLFNAIQVSGSPAYGFPDSSNFYLPDFRGRIPVGLGTHTDVSALAANDGLSVASRTPKVAHTHTVPAHKHAISTGNMTTTVTVAANTTNLLVNNGSGSAYMAGSGSFGPYASIGTHNHTATATTSGTAGAVGSPDGDSALTSGSDATPAPYLVVNYIIKVGI